MNDSPTFGKDLFFPNFDNFVTHNLSEALVLVSWVSKFVGLVAYFYLF